MKSTLEKICKGNILCSHWNQGVAEALERESPLSHSD